MPSPASAAHPLTRPGWVAFSLVVLAVPLGMMLAPPAPPPLPHLARMPAVDSQLLHGPTVDVQSAAGVVDVSAWPCSAPCIARTGALAALAHGPSPPPLVTVLTTTPDAHPAIDAAQAVEGWSVLQVEDADALHATWFAARGSAALPTGGLMVVDRHGSVRAVVPATPEGVEAARRAWHHLQSADPG